MRCALPTAAGPLFCAALALPAFAQDEEAAGARTIEQRTQEIRESASPCVVSVTVTTRAFTLPRLAFPGLVIAPSGRESETIEGTGFFVSSRGLLVTTRDLVADAARIEVRFRDGSVRDASLVGVDGPFRMAVLRTSAPAGVTGLPCAPRVEASDSTVGWFVGAAEGGGTSTRSDSSVDVQVASVRPAPEGGATYDRFLYAPISLARGAAGGPLVGADCRLLGMAVGSLVAREGQETPGVSMRLPRATLFVRGDDLADAARQIAANGAVERPMLGAFFDGDSTRIQSLLPAGPAQSAGLVEGDAIVGVGAMTVGSFADFARAMLRRRVGEPVRIVVDRGGERVVKTVTLSARTPPPTPTTPPIAGTVIEFSCDDKGDPVYTFVDVRADSAAAKAGLRAGDRLIAVDGRCPTGFLRRHCLMPTAPAPAKLDILRDGVERAISLPTE